MDNYILCVGNPFDGITSIGPFSSSKEANEFAGLNYRHDDWWVIMLIPQEEIQYES